MEGKVEGSLQLLMCGEGAHSVDLRLQRYGKGVKQKKERGK